METTTLAVVAAEEALGLPVGPMSDSEKRDRDNCHHKIKACSEGIGAALSHIYNHRLFRGDGGDQGWEEYVREDLPEWLDDRPSITTADRQRMLHEARTLLASRLGGHLPCNNSQAEMLRPLIPRRDVRHDDGQGGSWYPAILDDPDAAEGIAKVWELACRNADQNQRRNGPTAEDVRAAREELRPELERDGLIRSAPASFQSATAARVEAARQRTIDVAASSKGHPGNVDQPAATPEAEAAARQAFRETMAQIRDTKAERTAKVEADEVRDELTRAEREHRHLLEEEVRVYNGRLHATSKAVSELFSYLENLSRIHGTQLLDEMRCTDVLGLITVSDDMDRLKAMGQELMEAIKLARSSAPSTGVNMTTIEVNAAGT